MKVIIHVGIPRTASTFLQKFIFPQSHNRTIIYNPEYVINIIRELHRQSHTQPLSPDDLDRSRQLIFDHLKSSQAGTLLLSSESFSMDPWRQDYRIVETIGRLFPTAIIILILRFQPDFVLSLHRLSVQKGFYNTLTQFTGFTGKDFLNSNSDLCFKDRKNTINIHTIDYNKLISLYHEYFSSNNIHIMFFEDFISNKNLFIDNICKIIGMDNITYDFPVVNKSPAIFSVIFFTNIISGITRLIDFFDRSIKAHTFLYPILIIPYILSKASRKIFKYFSSSLLFWPPMYKLHYTSSKECFIKKNLSIHFLPQNQKLLNFLPGSKIPPKYLKQQ